MDLYDISATTIDGEAGSMAQFRGRTLLIVNVASKCGFTPQYTGLETLWKKYQDKGLTVLGFPCDQFGHQEPGDEAEIKDFCVNRPNTHQLFQLLKSSKPGALGTEAIKWNFTKFPLLG